MNDENFDKCFKNDFFKDMFDTRVEKHLKSYDRRMSKLENWKAKQPINITLENENLKQEIIELKEKVFFEHPQTVIFRVGQQKQLDELNKKVDVLNRRITELKERFEADIPAKQKIGKQYFFVMDTLSNFKEVLWELKEGTINMLTDIKAHRGLRLHETIFLENLEKLKGKTEMTPQEFADDMIKEMEERKKTKNDIDIPYSMCDRITPKYETPKSFERLKEFFDKDKQKEEEQSFLNRNIPDYHLPWCKSCGNRDNWFGGCSTCFLKEVPNHYVYESKDKGEKVVEPMIDLWEKNTITVKCPFCYRGYYLAPKKIEERLFRDKIGVKKKDLERWFRVKLNLLKELGWDTPTGLYMVKLQEDKREYKIE